MSLQLLLMMSHSVLSFLIVASYVVQTLCAPSLIPGSLALSRHQAHNIGGGGSSGEQREGKGGNVPASIGPLMPESFPDPAIIEVEGMFYAFSTQSGGVNIPVAHSEDLLGLDLLKMVDGTLQDAMSTLPSIFSYFGQR